MKKVVPQSGKVAREARECVQVSQRPTIVKSSCSIRLGGGGGSSSISNVSKFSPKQGNIFLQKF